MVNIFTSEQYQSFCDLKKILNRQGPINTEYWELVTILNRRVHSSANNDSYFGLSKYYDLPIASKIDGWTVSNETNFMKVPSHEEYNSYLSAIGKERMKVSIEEYVPQGLWSVYGIRTLSNQLYLNQTRVTKLASDSIQFLTELTREISDIFPYSSICNGRDAVKTIKRFLGGNTIINSEDYDSTVKYAINKSSTSDYELMQIIFNLLEDPQEQIAVSLKPFNYDTVQGHVITDDNLFTTGISATNDGTFVSGSNSLSISSDYHLVSVYDMESTHTEINFDIPGIYRSSKKPMKVSITVGSTGALTNSDIKRIMRSGDISSPRNKILYILARILHKLHKTTAAVARPFWDYIDSLDTLYKTLFNDFDAALKGITVTSKEDKTNQNPVEIPFLLTPFVLLKKSISSNPSDLGNIKLHMMDNELKKIDSRKDLDSAELSIMERYSNRHDLFGTLRTFNGWLQLRWEEFVFKSTPGSQKSWNKIDRLLSAFLLETQMSQTSFRIMPMEVVPKTKIRGYSNRKVRNFNSNESLQ